MILAYIMHLGAIPIPKTDDEGQMKENFEAQKIELNVKQMRMLGKLDLGEEGRVFNFRYLICFFSLLNVMMTNIILLH